MDPSVILVSVCQVLRCEHSLVLKLSIISVDRPNSGLGK